MSFAPTSIQDPFHSLSSGYVRYRPRYPKALFDYIASLCSQHQAAWDCATGNGQVAVALTDYFDHITATDRSANMIAEALQNSKIIYRIALAEQSGLPDASVDLVTVGTALHWLNTTSFFPEVHRVLKPGGIFAAWGYTNSHILPPVDRISDQFYFETLKDSWSSDMSYIWSGFRNRPFPFNEIQSPQFQVSVEWNFEEFFMYLKTFSALETFCVKHGYDALDHIRDALASAWGDLDERRKVSWNLVLKIGRS